MTTKYELIVTNIYKDGFRKAYAIYRNTFEACVDEVDKIKKQRQESPDIERQYFEINPIMI